MMDIHNNIEDHDSNHDTDDDDDDDVENEAYYDKQDLDPFTINEGGMISIAMC